MSAGTGSPLFFRCPRERISRRRSVKGEHVITLTGRQRPYRSRRRHSVGLRSTRTAREYECSCGHVGWSNHVDLARLAGDDHTDVPRSATPGASRS